MSIPKPLSIGEETLALQMRALGIEYVREYHFCPTRKFRFDFYIPSASLGIEVDGSVWTNGRHTRGSGYVKDLEKFNLAIELSVKVLRYSTEMVMSGVAISQIEPILNQ